MVNGDLAISMALAPGPVTVTFGTRSLRQTPIIEVLFGANF